MGTLDRTVCMSDPPHSIGPANHLCLLVEELAKRNRHRQNLEKTLPDSDHSQ